MLAGVEGECLYIHATCKHTHTHHTNIENSIQPLDRAEMLVYVRSVNKTIHNAKMTGTLSMATGTNWSAYTHIM